MPQSDLAQMIQNSDGKILLGSGIDYSGVFEVLGTELEPRIRNIGSAPSSLSDGASLTYNNSSVSGIDFSLIGEWGNNPQFKLVRLRLSAFGGVPFTRDEKTYVASDKCNPQLNNTSYNAGFIFPNDLESTNLEALGNRQGGVLGGICVNCSMGQEWLYRAFQNNSLFSISNNGTEFQTLVDKGLIHAEIIFKMGTSNGQRIIMPVIMGDRITGTDRFRASLTAMNCASQDVRNGGLKLFDDDKREILGDDSPIAISSSFDNKTGAFKSITIDKIKALEDDKFAGSVPYQSTAVSVFVRFFIMKENYDAACSATGKKFPEDIMKVNGEDGVGLTYTSIGDSISAASGPGAEKRNQMFELYGSKPVQSSYGGPFFKGYCNSHESYRGVGSYPTAQITIPWICYVETSYSSDVSGWHGLAALNDGKKLVSGNFSQEEIQAMVEEYRARGGVKINMNRDAAQNIQSWFNAIGDYYGHDIIWALPSFCRITSIGRSASGEAKNSRHKFGLALDFNGAIEKDYHGSVPDSTSSVFWVERNRLMRPILEISNRHGVRWGGNAFGTRYDLMHFDWD